MEKKTSQKSGKLITLKKKEEMDSVSPEEQNVFHKTKIVISAIKYLKKVIHRLSKEEMDMKNKQKLFFHYNDLVDVIVDHSKKIEIDKLPVPSSMASISTPQNSSDVMISEDDMDSVSTYGVDID